MEPPLSSWCTTPTRSPGAAPPPVAAPNAAPPSASPCIFCTRGSRCSDTANWSCEVSRLPYCCITPCAPAGSVRLRMVMICRTAADVIVRARNGV